MEYLQNNLQENHRKNHQNNCQDSGQDTAYLDVLRWIAISAVVMLHVASGIVDTVCFVIGGLFQAVWW